MKGKKGVDSGDQATKEDIESDVFEDNAEHEEDEETIEENNKSNIS